MNLSSLYYSLLAIGLLMVFLPPIIPAAKKEKLAAVDFGLQVTLPTTFGLALLLLAYWGLYRTTFDEVFWQRLIALTASGGVFLALVTAFQSIVRIRWKSD